MKNRFQPDRLTPWRQRFLAIARELGGDPVRRHEMAGTFPAGRGALPVRGSLRGIRLGCVRTA